MRARIALRSRVVLWYDVDFKKRKVKNIILSGKKEKRKVFLKFRRKGGLRLKTNAVLKSYEGHSMGLLGGRKSAVSFPHAFEG